MKKKQASGIDVFCNYDKLIDVTELIPNPRNPNSHPEKQVALLAKIIRQQGWRSPIVVSERSGFIVKGHGRFEASKLLEVEEVPVEIQYYENEASEYADMIADNRIAELSTMDRSNLRDILADVEIDDLDLTGYDEEARKLLLDSDVSLDGLFDEDHFDEPDDDPEDADGDGWICEFCGKVNSPK